MNPPGESLTQLILTESESDRVKWVNALQQLHKVLKENKQTSKTVSYLNEKCFPLPIQELFKVICFKMQVVLDIPSCFLLVLPHVFSFRI